MCIEIGVEPIGIGVAELDEIDARGELFEPRQDRIVGSDDRGSDVRIEGEQRSLRSEEHTSELQSRFDLVCRLLLEKKKNTPRIQATGTHKTYARPKHISR